MKFELNPTRALAYPISKRNPETCQVDLDKTNGYWIYFSVAQFELIELNIASCQLAAWITNQCSCRAVFTQLEF